MAILAVSNVYESYIYLKVLDLEHPANQYSMFELQVYEFVNGSWSHKFSIQDQYNHSNNYLTLATGFNRLWFGTNYRFLAYALYNGVWYPIPPGPDVYVEDQTTIASPPYFFLDSVDGNSFDFLVDGTFGIYGIEIVYQKDGGIQQIYNAGVDPSGNGNVSGILYGLDYDSWYTFWCRGYSINSSVKTGLSSPVRHKTATLRPTNFAWTNSKTSNGAFNLSASEWNALTSRINQFRAYKGLSSYSFTTAILGNNFQALYYTQARTAISDMTPPVSVPSIRNTGDLIYASDMNQLRDSLNSIT
jgi:hypothetical protein